MSKKEYQVLYTINVYGGHMHQGNASGVSNETAPSGFGFRRLWHRR
ncbi:hypothetical protein ABIB85_008067 [Bradyrhizobium sp. JR1.5]